MASTNDLRTRIASELNYGLADAFGNSGETFATIVNREINAAINHYEDTRFRFNTFGMMPLAELQSGHNSVTLPSSIVRLDTTRLVFDSYSYGPVLTKCGYDDIHSKLIATTPKLNLCPNPSFDGTGYFGTDWTSYDNIGISTITSAENQSGGEDGGAYLSVSYTPQSAANLFGVQMVRGRIDPALDPNTNYVVSAYCKASVVGIASAPSVYLGNNFPGNIAAVAENASDNQAVTSAWQRFYWYIVTSTAPSQAFEPVFFMYTSSQDPLTFSIDKVQIEKGGILSTWQDHEEYTNEDRSTREWAVYGNEIFVYPAPSSADTIQVAASGIRRFPPTSVTGSYTRFSSKLNINRAGLYTQQSLTATTTDSHNSRNNGWTNDGKELVIARARAAIEVNYLRKPDAIAEARGIAMRGEDFLSVREMQAFARLNNNMADFVTAGRVRPYKI